MPFPVQDEAKVKPATVGQEGCCLRTDVLHTLDVGRHGRMIIREQLRKAVLLVGVDGECERVVDSFRPASHEVGGNHPFGGMPSPDVCAKAYFGFELEGGFKRLVY